MAACCRLLIRPISLLQNVNHQVTAVAPQCRFYSAAPEAANANTDRLSLAFDHHEPPASHRHHQDEPIIFMHGLFGSKRNNRTVSRALAKSLRRHVYALDLRNHGDSPHSTRHDYLAMSGDVAGFIDYHGLKNPTLIGHSMGAKTAMTLALSQPDLIKDIIPVDNAPIDAVLGSGFPEYIRGMKKIDESNVTRLSDADKILADHEKELPIRQFLLANLHRPKGSDIGGALKFRIPLNILARSLGHLGDFPFKDPAQTRFVKPALFVRGTQSHYVADEALPLIGQFFPRFSLADIDAGHWVISEKPHDFMEAVMGFLGPED